MFTPRIFALLLVSFATTVVLADESLDEIVNYREYSSAFSSSGQPSAEDLAHARDAGFQRVVYIAYSDHGNSLENEDRVVKNLGMEYVHIPVEWEAPTANDFKMFAGAMRQAPASRTLLHCQVNYRASAFSMLYRVIHEGVPLAEAKADMNTVWTPNEIWRDLIFEVLEANDISPDCDGCDWSTENH